MRTPRPRTCSRHAAPRPHWVIGFQDDRAALLTRLEWVDPAGSNPQLRLRRVRVEVSTQSPLRTVAGRGDLEARPGG
ncbi:MAG: hypothetical protein R3C32_08465 [Chloroflexota bacterium]